MLRPLRLRHIWAGLMLCCSVLFAQEFTHIENLQLVAGEDSIRCRFGFPNLISGKVEQALLSGLPLRIEISPVLTIDSRNSESKAVQRRYECTYDIWEDRFAVASQLGFRFFTNLDSLRGYWRQHPAVGLRTTAGIASGSLLQVTVTTDLTLLSRNDGRKLQDWIFETGESGGNSPSFNQDTGFRLNLNRFISIFLGSADIADSDRSTATSPAIYFHQISAGKPAPE